MQWELRQIPPIELHAIMDLVRPGIERVRTKGKAPWKWEDVYAAVQSGRATMHVGYLDKLYAGVVVLAMNTDPFSGERSMLVWALYAGGGSGKRPSAQRPGLIPFNPRVLWYGLRDVRELARKAGITKLIFHSTRDGWVKRMAEIGFKIKERVFEAEV